MDYFDLLGKTSAITGLLASLFSFGAWIHSLKLRQEIRYEKQRLAEHLNIVLSLHTGTRKAILPIRIQRGDLSRAELLGRLGMLPMKEPGQRFSIFYLNSQEFLNSIDQLKNSSGNGTIVIPCSQQEFDQFNLSGEQECKI